MLPTLSWAWLRCGSCHRKEACVLLPMIQGKTLYLGSSYLLHLQVTDVNLTPYLALRRH